MWRRPLSSSSNIFQRRTCVPSFVSFACTVTKLFANVTNGLTDERIRRDMMTAWAAQPQLKSILRYSTLWSPGPTMGPGPPKFLNTPKVLLDYHYDQTSVLCTNICGRKSILRDSTLWGPGPTMGPGPEIPEHPEGTAVRLSLWPNISTVH